MDADRTIINRRLNDTKTSAVHDTRVSQEALTNQIYTSTNSAAGMFPMPFSTSQSRVASIARSINESSVSLDVHKKHRPIGQDLLHTAGKSNTGCCPGFSLYRPYLRRSEVHHNGFPLVQTGK